MQHINVFFFIRIPLKMGEMGHGLLVVENYVDLARGPAWEDCCNLNVMFSIAWKICNQAGWMNLHLFRSDIWCWSWKIYFAVKISNYKGFYIFETCLIIKAWRTYKNRGRNENRMEIYSACRWGPCSHVSARLTRSLIPRSIWGTISCNATTTFHQLYVKSNSILNNQYRLSNKKKWKDYVWSPQGLGCGCIIILVMSTMQTIPLYCRRII